LPLVPYAGNPDNFPAEIDTLDDSVQRTASNLNAAPEGLADRTAWLKARADLGAVEYGPAVLSTAMLAPSDNAVVTCGKWDPFGKAWLLCGMSAANGSGNTTTYEPGNGIPDGSLGAIGPNVSSGHRASIAPFDVVFDGTKYLEAGILVGGAAVVAVCSPGGAWALPFSDSGDTYTSTSLKVLASGQTLLAYSSATQTLLYYSNDHGATWTNSTFAIAGFTGGIGEIIVGDSTSIVIVISSSSKNRYITGTDGAGLWTTRVVPWANTEIPMGATYARDDAGPCFFVVTKTGGGGMNVWKSADGINWSQVGGTIASFSPSSMASIGSALAVAAPVSSGITGGVYVSFDFGLSWRWAINSRLLDSTPYAGLRPQVVAGESQFMCLWQTAVRFSGAVLPPSVVS
jgi:hypothetical protein